MHTRWLSQGTATDGGLDRGMITGMHVIVFAPETGKAGAVFAGVLGGQPAGPAEDGLSSPCPRLNLPFIPLTTAVTSSASCATTSRRPWPS